MAQHTFFKDDDDTASPSQGVEAGPSTPPSSSRKPLSTPLKPAADAATKTTDEDGKKAATTGTKEVFKRPLDVSTNTAAAGAVNGSSSSSAAQEPPKKKQKKKASLTTVSFHEQDDRDREASTSTRAAVVSPGKKADRQARKEALVPERQKLPVWEGKQAILDAVGRNDTTVVLAETGSGKTTQIPQFLLFSQIPIGANRIAVTQPRRVAATSLAARVAEETAAILGKAVGYTVRFDDRSCETTRLKFVTDGTLLREMLEDRDLEKYDIVVLDEAHERSLRTDMIMGFLKDIQKRRKEKRRLWQEGVRKGEISKASNTEKKAGSLWRDPGEATELKVVIMSATLDAQRFSDFFGGAEIMYVQGRQHAVKILYAPEPQADFLAAALTTIVEVHVRHPPGDILVFLPGQDDIESLSASLGAIIAEFPAYSAKHNKKLQELHIAPMYAKLPPAEQARAFEKPPPNTRKVILATNVAETSVTIPGVRYVIDTGLCKQKDFLPSTGIEQLRTTDVSQSSAQQRSGRAGREAPGTCFRLYTEASYLQLAKTAKPEIQRVSLTFSTLHLLAAGQEDIEKFEYMDRPDRPAIAAALMTLSGLGAVAAGKGAVKYAITPLGKQMATLPLDPIFARILLHSYDTGCAAAVLSLVSLLGQKDSLLVNNAAVRDEANEARAQFVARSGDHFMLLKVLRAYEEVEKGERRQWCRDHFVKPKAMENVLDARRQLQERCEKLGLKAAAKSDASTDEEEEDLVLNAVLKGLWKNTALLHPDGTYRQTNANRQTIHIHPSSCLMGKRKPAIMFDELVLTSRTYARGVSSIDPIWLQTMVPEVFGKGSQQ